MFVFKYCRMLFPRQCKFCGSATVGPENRSYGIFYEIELGEFDLVKDLEVQSVSKAYSVPL